MNKNMNHAQLYFLWFTCDRIERDLLSKLFDCFDILGTNSENLLKTKKFRKLRKQFRHEPISKKCYMHFLKIFLFIPYRYGCKQTVRLYV